MLRQRRELTDKRVACLQQALEQVGAHEIVGNAGCVYATGSVGRGEMSTRSDLDVFIVRDRSVAPPLTRLEEIRLKARLIEESENAGFPEFSEDGEYLQAHDVQEDLLEKLGSREDDYKNVLTARLLLLLESRPILGEAIYERAIKEILGRYWRDYERNTGDFRPVFLTNDILRFWKTLCLNYEKRTEEGGRPGKRPLMNYKLKYSRLLTCYSAVVYLTAQSHLHRTVTLEHAQLMVAKSPTARLEHVAEVMPDVASVVDGILASYCAFLETCDEDKTVLEVRFAEPAFKRDRFAEARAFGDQIFELLNAVGKETQLLRYLVV